MDTLLALPAFLATIISISSLTWLSLRIRPVTMNLSQIGAHSDANLRYFRIILVICPILFAITMYGLIVPNSTGQPALIVSSLLMFIGDVLLAAIPARGRLARPHDVAAKVMAFGMLLLAYFLAMNQRAPYNDVGFGLAIAMTVLALTTFADKRHFIIYELTFIYLSHVTILVAAISIVLTKVV